MSLRVDVALLASLLSSLRRSCRPSQQAAIDIDLGSCYVCHFVGAHRRHHQVLRGADPHGDRSRLSLCMQVRSFASVDSSSPEFG
jgi:hypothetical protein